MSFAIDDLASVLSHWSADQISGLSDGDAVSTFPDSVAGWDLSGTTTTRPLYRPTSSIASLPAIEFDGTDDYLLSASRVFSGVKSPRSAIVFRLGSLKNYNSTLCLTTSTANPANGATSTRFQACRAYSTGQVVAQYATASVTGSLVSGTGVVAATTTYLLRTDATELQRSIVLNGKELPVSGSSDGSVINTTMYAQFGRENLAGAFFGGLVAEVVLWDETLLCESMYIEGVLAHKYGLTLPATHPFYSAAPTTGPSAGGGGVRMVNIRGGADQ